MNKSKITKINVHSTGQSNLPTVPPNSSNDLSSNLTKNLPSNLPMSSKSNIEFEHYDFTTPMNTIDLKKCNDLNSISSSNDYSIDFLHNKNGSNRFKNEKEHKKCFLPNQDMNCNDKSASEFQFTSYTEPCKMMNSTNNNKICLPESLISNSSETSSSDSHEVVNEITNTDKRLNRNKIIIRHRKKVLNKTKNCLNSSMLMPICSSNKMPSWSIQSTKCMNQCSFNYQQCMIKKHELEQNNERFKLSNKCEFLLFCIGSTIHLPNIWRFPYLCYNNNGGTFLVAYFVCCVLIGFPLLLIELSLGQFSKMNSVLLFKNMVPLFKGLSSITVLTSTVQTIYLNLILSWTLIYLYESFRGMKWKRCDSLYSSISRCSNRLFLISKI